ncbi:MAG: tripartite tricarboxylate transporter substrate binding protein [Deltaproteobacteria bacterium]|nr:tripartite tricarboxylate transporter substrate binding protein [Deltaproteobacteria bacterium]
MRRKGFYCTIVVVLSLFCIAPAFAPQAQAAYPEPDKVIEFLHHSSPGGAAGLFVLTTGDILNKTGIVKAKIQTQTRQGGSSAVALNYLKSKGGDPYVVMHWTTAQLMAMLRGTTQMKLEECVWLSTMIEDGNVMMVPASSQFKTLKELIEYAKANPKKVSVGINSIGGSEHVMAARIERATGAKFNITAFDFSPTQLIGGHIDVAFGSTAETAGHYKAKRVRVLANMGERRVPYYKDIPTMKEQGVPVSFTQVRGFFGGPNYPTEAYNFWQDAFAKVMKTMQYQEFIKKFDVVPDYMNGADTKKWLVDYVKGLQEDLKYIETNK